MEGGPSQNPVAVRAMTIQDLPEIVDLHLQLFDDTPSRLGRAFLSAFYRRSLNDVALVATADEAMLGYQLTVLQGQGAAPNVPRRGGLQLVLAALPRVLRNPHLQLRLVRSVTMSLRRRRRGDALALYTAVSPQARGRGVAKLMQGGWCGRQQRVA